MHANETTRESSRDNNNGLRRLIDRAHQTNFKVGPKLANARQHHIFCLPDGGGGGATEAAAAAAASNLIFSSHAGFFFAACQVSFVN